MKLTSQEEYGLRCLLALTRQTRLTLTVNQIAKKEGISTEYAGKLMGILGKAGLVESVRGRYGGFRLTRNGGEITVAQVMLALGSKLYDGTTCDRFAGDHSLCIHTEACSTRSLWQGLQSMIDHVLENTTLDDMTQQNEQGMTHWIREKAETLLSESVGSAPNSFEVGGPLPTPDKGMEPRDPKSAGI